MKLIIIIPAFNEEKTIARVIQEIPRNIEGIDELKVLVIDDGSTDDTVKEAKNAGALVVSHTKNEGLGIAFSTGLKEALKQGADIMVNIDADGQFDAKDIPKLVRPILEKRAEMVAGSRFEDKTSISQIPLIKRWGNKAFTSLINILTRQHFTDTQCGFRAYSREAILRLNLFGRFTYTQEVFLDLVNKGLKIEQVPIKVKYYKDRQAKISSSLFGYFLRTIVIILRTFRDYKPLIFFGIPGLTVFGAGIIFWLYSFVYWLIHFQTTPVRMYFFIGAALLIFSFLLIILALIADMLKRIRQNQEEILYKLKKQEYKKDEI
jgi:glycosyltransferase involved in cell wall biosynthesis